jgi:hypothetical protein
MNSNEQQIRHEKIINLLNQFSQYQDENRAPRCKIIKEQISSSGIEKLDFNDINLGVIVLTDFLNLDGGTIGSIDLYQLLQVYFLDRSRRELINKIIR